MNQHDQKMIVCIAAVACIIVLLAACSEADELVQPAPDAEAAVIMGAQTGALAAPAGDAAADLIVGLMDLIEPGPLAMTAGEVAPAIINPTCPETFELPSGITGTCSMDAAGVLTFLFGGSLLVDGGNLAVEGSMTATPSAEQPATGAAYDIVFSAAGTGDRFSGTWDGTGTVWLNDAGEVVDYDLAMNNSLTPAGGSTTSVRLTVDPNTLELRLTGPMGGNLLLDLDRDTMTGTLSLDGIQVATVSIAGGCATLVSSIPELPDQTICGAPI